MDNIAFITEYFNWIVLAVAIAVFASRGLWLPWQDDGSFLKATVKHSPKVQCGALILIGYGLASIPGAVAGWFADGRAWLLDQIITGADWAFGGGVGVLAAAVFGLIVIADYIVPGGLEPKKPLFHMLMWIISFLVHPLLTLALGSVSLIGLVAVFLIMWFINVKFRRGKKTNSKRETADANS